MANQISSQREENFEDPEKFKPERWLNPSEECSPKNSYLPFGKGLKSCIGESMAKLEMMLLTTKVNSNIHFIHFSNKICQTCIPILNSKIIIDSHSQSLNYSADIARIQSRVRLRRY